MYTEVHVVGTISVGTDMTSVKFEHFNDSFDLLLRLTHSSNSPNFLLNNPLEGGHIVILESTELVIEGGPALLRAPYKHTYQEEKDRTTVDLFQATTLVNGAIPVCSPKVLGSEFADKTGEQFPQTPEL